MSFKRMRPSPALVVAFIALFVAMSGVGYTAAKINGKRIKNSSISGGKLKRKTVTAARVKDETLTGTQINESTLSLLGSTITTRRASVPFPGDNSTGVTAQCAAGEKLIGGGGSIDAAGIQRAITSSRPSTAAAGLPADGAAFDAWRVNASSDIGASATTLRAWAVCASL